MRTRNAGVAKPPAQPPAPKKRTPTTRKTSARKAAATTTPVEESTPELVTPTSELVTPTSAETPSPVVEPESSQPPIEQEKASAEDVVVTPPTKVTPASKKKVTKTKKVVKKVVRPKTSASAKAVSADTDEVPEAEDVKAGQGQKDEDVTDANVEQSLKAEEEVPKVNKSDEQEIREEELGDAPEKGKIKMDVDDLSTTDSKADDEVPKVTEPNEKEERGGDLGDDQDKGKHKMDVDGLSITDSKAEEEVPIITKPDEQEETEGELADTQDKGKDKMDVDDLSTADARIADKTDSTAAEDINKSAKELSSSTEGQQLVVCEEPIKEVSAAADMLESEKEPEGCQDNMDDDQKQENIEVDNQKLGNLDDGQTEEAEEASQVKEDNAPVSDKIEGYGDEEGFVEPGEEELHEDDEPEPEPETTDDGKALNDENKEMAAAAKERKIKKEHEIFVGGLDREVGEEDIKNAFEKVGEVIEVRLLKFPSTNKSRGFAFVRFATKDQAKKALSEMKNPVICGKQCGTAPNDENDTLFVGNICNTWTKEAISQKLKDYNVQGVENITLVQDPRHEGLSRGFCFVQFACHADAMSAYKKLQKPDVVFGHTERSAKVAIAEPLPEPDPEVMAKVKSVFIDGLPPYWDEDSVRKHFNTYGEITRVTLARNMSSAKRKDFGFVDYTTHEAAIACIDDVNKKELGDGNSKAKVRARLSNPSPKMQAVKGGMRGGFRIGQPSGRSLGRPAPPVNRPSYQYHRGPRAPFVDPVAVGPYVQRAPHRGGHGIPRGRGVGRPNFSGSRHGLIEHGPVRPIPPQREPFPINSGGFPRPFMGRPYSDPYLDDRQGLKRPFYMTEQDPAYIEPTRVRARYDYTNLGRGSNGGVGRGSHVGGGRGSHVGVGRGSHVGDAFAAGGSTYPSGYYGPDYGARPAQPVRPPPSFNSRGRPYGGGPGGRGGGGNGPSGYYY